MTPDAALPTIGLLDVSPSSADGWPTIIRTGLVEARVLRVLDQDVEPGDTSVLTGTWGEPRHALPAGQRRRARRLVARTAVTPGPSAGPDARQDVPCAR